MTRPAAAVEGDGRVQLRPMVDDDVVEVDRVWHEAFTAMRSRFAKVSPRSPERVERERRRIRHVMASDPDGSWVAVEGERVVGLVQALSRDRLWVLSLLAVAVEAQGRGIGRRLLERALGHGTATGPGLIISSRDPKGIRAYALAGFRLLPAVTAMGPLRATGLSPVDGVRPGGAQDLDMAAEVDRKVRGAPHGPDLSFLLENGHDLLVADAGGYAVVRRGQPLILAALDEEAARALLVSALAQVPAGGSVELHWLTGAQQWAIEVAVAVGLELHPVGPVMVRGDPGPLAPYVPSGAFG